MAESGSGRAPLLRNVYWGQVFFGAGAALLGWSLARHHLGLAPLSAGGLLVRWIGLLVLLLAFLVYLQNLYRHGIVPDYSFKCRFCEGPVNRYSEFCEHCGADLIAEEKLIACPSCGIELYEGTKHCPECGSKVAAASSKSKRPKR